MLLIVASGDVAAEELAGKKAAWFGVTYLDTSYEGEIRGPRADEQARVAMVEDYFTDELEAHGLELVDLSPVAEELARIVNPAECYGCDTRMAQELGVPYSIVAEVQKVSNLILSMNLQIRDAATGRQVRALAVDIRGNTDESWRRGARYVIERGIFTE